MGSGITGSIACPRELRRLRLRLQTYGLRLLLFLQEAYYDFSTQYQLRPGLG